MVLYRTDKVRTTSSNFGDGKTYPAEAWFELQLQEGSPDPSTCEGGGRTIASWRGDFARLRDPRHIVINCSGADDVAGAVIPNDVLDSLVDDARISFVWYVCRVSNTIDEPARGAA